MKYRIVKLTPEGEESRQAVRDVVRGVHIIPLRGRWQVRTTGEKPLQKTFRHKADAIEFARSVGRRKRSKIVLHGGRSRRASVFDPSPAVTHE